MNKEQIAEWIDGIIRDLTDKDKTLEDCLRKTLVLSFKLKNDRLKTWVESELNGYASEELLPDYRLVGLEIWGNLAQPTYGGIITRRASLHFQGSPHPYLVKLQEGYPLLSTVASLESILRPLGDNHGSYLTFNLSPHILKALEKLYDGWIIEKAWIQLSEFTITAVLSQVKTNLLQFLLVLSDELGTDTNFSVMNNQDKVNRILEHTIGHVHAENVTFGTNYQTKGNQNNVVQGNQNTQQISSSGQVVTAIKELVEQIKSQLQEATDIEPDIKEQVALQVATLEKQANKDKPNFDLIGKSMQIIESLLLDAASSAYVPLILEGIRHLLPQLTK
ncbi:AbiTii domain-containing protein [Spirosoma aerolatum]|uniref:AbiTii domain-containing protein n=1 Tax=Spirosoma aerolatum TaxID=1211326 RepID=UPI0009ABE880|nr:hypothetical protein [Spirosoma aerolatum]